MRLKDLREDRDETQRQMAALLNVGQSTYSMYENGQREIPLAALCKLADHYDVTLDYLVGRSDAIIYSRTQKRVLRKCGGTPFLLSGSGGI